MRRIQKMLLLIVATFTMISGVNAAETLQSKLDAGEKNIVLDQNYNENITIKEKSDVTIDLNGYKLTGRIIDLGNLTIKSSKAGGKIISDKSIVVGDYEKNEKKEIVKTIFGKFTLESGTIEVTGDYGVYCMSGSTAVVNGGEIVSLYSPLTGNNTTGAMNFVVNDGVLTAKKGPAIYMPGPISLTITGGTLNGGISLRMGKVNISGGTINAANVELDNIKDYYSYSGNAWLEDALYVFGGTYTTDIKGETNILDLNITGGTFNVTNKKGSAIAIYDIGKVAQEMKINISGNAKLITNSTTRNAYDILNLTDLGVENIKAGYNKLENIGKVNTVISGGTFSTSVKEYVAKEYIEEKVDNNFVVAKKEEVKVDTPTIDTTKPVKDVTVGVKETKDLDSTLKDALNKSNIDVVNTNAIVSVEIANQKENQAPAKAVKSIKEVAEKMNLVSYFDITIAVKNSITGDSLGNLSELDKKIAFNMALPEDIAKVEEGYTRKYFVIRYHNGKSEIIPATVEGNVLSFESDKFSTYALAYEDTKTVVTPPAEVNPPVENPSTGDNIILNIALGLISIVGIGATTIIAKRKKSVN